MQNLEMLGDVLLRQAERVRELLWRRRAAGELFDQTETDRLTEDGKALSHLR